MTDTQTSDCLYTALAPHFGSYSRERVNYLNGVERLIATSTGTCSALLDVGSGDGVRAGRLAASLDASVVTYLEPCEAMARLIRPVRRGTVVIGDITTNPLPVTGPYDVVTCLWNVLGHIPSDQRGRALRNMASLLARDGSIFLDVNHRHNVAQYGLRRAGLNAVLDLARPAADRGDVSFAFDIDGVSIPAAVHLFSRREVDSLVADAGLRTVHRWAVSYATGAVRPSAWLGQLVYELRR